MIKFPDNIDEEFKTSICRQLYEKDRIIEQLDQAVASWEKRVNELVTETILLRKYEGYSILDMRYPKSFGTGHSLEDFPEGSFIENGFFVIKKQ